MEHTNPDTFLKRISESNQQTFQRQKNILTFQNYIDLFYQKPVKLSRTSPEYIKEMIEHFGIEEGKNSFENKKFNLFEKRKSSKGACIVGQNAAQERIYKILQQFVRQERANKLILLHGPNGSSKTSTAETIAEGMEEYSKTDDGATYHFSWVFPIEKLEPSGTDGSIRHIGFTKPNIKNKYSSFAELKDEEVACKIHSEMKENPIYLIPKEERIELYKEAVAAEKNIPKDEVEIPICISDGHLSTKNRMIFDALYLSYKGDLEQVFRHVQVERLYYSAKYRTGISTVEPQMNVDAAERQLTMEKSLQNLPAILQNIRIFEPQGELIDANRGFVEFADLLKRPVEGFKYLLNAVERGSISLSSGVFDLDLVMFAGTNEKHLDAFKSSPDWASFKGRFELVRVPYLLNIKDEMRIYQQDLKIIENEVKVTPHSLELLVRWAILTRLRQPEFDHYEATEKKFVQKMGPFEKLAIYNEEDFGNSPLNEEEEKSLMKMARKIMAEGTRGMAYEGRFGASPRELKMILHFAAHNPEYDCLSPLGIFEEIERLVHDKTVYEYLQYEPRGDYHAIPKFLEFIKLQYAQRFYRDFLGSLNLVDETQYSKILKKYLKHAVASMKGEKIENEITGNAEKPDLDMLKDIEKLMGFENSGNEEVRRKLVSKVASWKVDNPKDEVQLEILFAKELSNMIENTYAPKEEHIKKIQNGILRWKSEKDYQKLPKDTLEDCERVFLSMESIGYTRKLTWKSLIFIKSYDEKRLRSAATHGQNPPKKETAA